MLQVWCVGNAHTYVFVHLPELVAPRFRTLESAETIFKAHMLHVTEAWDKIEANMIDAASTACGRLAIRPPGHLATWLPEHIRYIYIYISKFILLYY